MTKLSMLFALPAVVAALAFAQAAQAHAALVSSTPAANETVASPSKIILTFNEPLVAKFASASLTMTAMPGMTDHPPMKINGFTAAMSKDAKTMTLLMKRALVAGTYSLKWAAAGMDTHRMEDSFTFTVK
jgi:copper resistance protein C